MKVTILGCGNSVGVPAAGGYWGDCDPNEPKNERLRASILVESGEASFLIDASYDVREQFNHHEIRDLSAVLISHFHADHISGLDDVRMVSFAHNKIIDVYANAEAIEELLSRGFYQFLGDGDLYKPFLRAVTVKDYDRFTIDGVDIQTFRQDHKTCNSLGFRFGDFAYSVDMADLEDEAIEALRGVKVWIVDACGFKRPEDKLGSHASLARVKKWVSILKPEMTYLTVLSLKMDYQSLCDELPAHIRPCYDGMVLEI